MNAYVCSWTLQIEGTENQKKIHFCVHLLEYDIFEAQKDFLKVLMLDLLSFIIVRTLHNI